MWDFLDELQHRRAPRHIGCDYGLVLSGGGARASYQAGVLQYIAETIQPVDLSIITGVSAGSLNAAYLANDTRGFPAAVENLVDAWRQLRSQDVYEAPSGFELLWSAVRNAGADESDEMMPRSGLVNTAPLRAFLARTLSSPDGRLRGITENIRNGQLDACAIITTNYGTGQTVAWAEGRDLKPWDRPQRVSFKEPLTIDHIMASSSLPFLFPAIELGDAWFGDGGIRLAEPLSPAIHLGANRILAVSTRYGRTQSEADEPVIFGYPPAAQIFGLLLNAIFLDRLDQDALTLERINRLLRMIPRRKRNGMRLVDLLVIRPSVDLGKLSGEYEAELNGVLGLLAKGLGSRDTKSPDWLSMILFEPDYAERLLEIGYRDAKAQHEMLVRFFDPTTSWICD